MKWVLIKTNEGLHWRLQLWDKSQHPDDAACLALHSQGVSISLKRIKEYAWNTEPHTQLKWHENTVPEAELKTKNSLILFVYSYREGAVLTRWDWEHQHVDRHRGGDSPPRGHRHHFHPLLETVSDRQAGVPARRHDLHPAETEGRVRSVSHSVWLHCVSVSKSFQIYISPFKWHIWNVM